MVRIPFSLLGSRKTGVYFITLYPPSSNSTSVTNCLCTDNVLFSKSLNFNPNISPFLNPQYSPSSTSRNQFRDFSIRINFFLCSLLRIVISGVFLGYVSDPFTGLIRSILCDTASCIAIYKTSRLLLGAESQYCVVSLSNRLI